MFGPGDLAEIFIALSGAAHLVTALILWLAFTIPAALVRWRGGTVGGTLLFAQMPALLAAGPSLLGALGCVAALILVLAAENRATGQLLETVAMYSVLVLPVPGFVLGLVGMLLFVRASRQVEEA
jgi:hypothetical protein